MCCPTINHCVIAKLALLNHKYPEPTQPAYQYSKVFMDERGDSNNAKTGPNGANLNDSFLNVGGADPEGQDE